MAPQSQPYPAGTRVNDRYVLRGLLGQGADGEVHRAWDENFQVEVALKLLRPINGQPASWDEAQILEHLQGDYLLPVHNADVIHGSDIRLLATKVMTGGDLDSAARPLGVSTRQAVRWASQLAHATERIHAASLIHRDIKPGNAYLDSDNSCHLADLGKAAKLDSRGFAPADGSFVTVAPEALRPVDPNCSIASDIYSLGATLFYLLTGEYPISPSGIPPARYRDMVVRGARRKVRDLAPHVTYGLGLVVERALALDPQRRQLSALSFANQLADARHYERPWTKILPHPGHDNCFMAVPTVKYKELGTCVVPTSGRYDIIVRSPRGRNLRRYQRLGLTLAEVTKELRAVFSDLT